MNAKIASERGKCRIVRYILFKIFKRKSDEIDVEKILARIDSQKIANECSERLRNYNNCSITITKTSKSI